MASPQGYARAFAHAGTPMSAPLARLVAAHTADHAAARGIPLGCLAHVLQAFGGNGNMQGAGPDAAAAVPGQVE